MAADETIDLREPVSNHRLLQEMVKLRRSLNRERWHKRILWVVVIVMLVLGVVAASNRVALDHQADRNTAAISVLNQQQMALDALVAQAARETANTDAALCSAINGTLNAAIDEQPPPTSVKAQWIRQAAVDQLERDVEHNLASIQCDLHLDPVAGVPPPTPPGVKPTVARSPSGVPVPPPSPPPVATTAPAATTTTTTIPATTTTMTCPRRGRPRC